MRIHVHAGAHKTASTYIQEILMLNRHALNAAGIGYAPLYPIREALTKQLGGTFRPEDRLDLFFADDVPAPADVRGLIISDEDLLGSTAEPLLTGGLYRSAARRARHLRHRLQGHRVSLFMSVRSYDEFFVSVYCQAMRWGQGFEPFEKFRAGLQPETFSWPRVCIKLAKALHLEEIVIWRYEDFRSHAESIIRRLAFSYQGALDMSAPDNLRASFSQAAIDRLTQIAREEDSLTASRRVDEIDAAFPKSAGLPPFMPWTDEERAALQARYEDDCRELFARG